MVSLVYISRIEHLHGKTSSVSRRVVSLWQSNKFIL